MEKVVGNWTLTGTEKQIKEMRDCLNYDKYWEPKTKKYFITFTSSCGVGVMWFPKPKYICKYNNDEIKKGNKTDWIKAFIKHTGESEDTAEDFYMESK